MLLTSLGRRIVPQLAARPNSTAAMLTAVSARLPFGATSSTTLRRAQPAPAPPAPSRHLFGFATRAQQEPQQPQQQQQGAQPQKEGAEATSMQPRSAAGSELARGGDLLDLAAVMPPPFRRMADHMMQMQREMDSLMGAFGMPSPLTAFADPFDILDRAAAPLVVRRAGGALGRVPALSRMVPLEVAEDPEGYTVTAEVPGFNKDEIKISLSEDGMLTMTGKHEEQETTAEAATKEGAKEGAQAAPRTTSRLYSSFVRSIALPDDADQGAITATTQHGVLTVRIPRTPKPAPKVREIPVA